VQKQGGSENASASRSFLEHWKGEISRAAMARGLYRAISHVFQTMGDVFVLGKINMKKCICILGTSKNSERTSLSRPLPQFLGKKPRDSAAIPAFFAEKPKQNPRQTCTLIVFRGALFIILLLSAALVLGCAKKEENAETAEISAKPRTVRRFIPPVEATPKATAVPAPSMPSNFAPPATPEPLSSSAPSLMPGMTPTPKPSNQPTPKPTELPNPLIIDLSLGKSASCFAGLDSETLSVSVSSQSGGGSYVFEGVYLSKILAKWGVTSYRKIEAVASDAMGAVDITEHMRSGDVLLAWRESKNNGAFVNENPIRSCPKNSTTAQHFVKYVGKIIVTR